MEKLRIIIWVCGFLFLTGPNLYAQAGPVSVGGKASGAQGTASYSIGQTNFTSTSTTEGTISQGLQQAYEIYVLSGIDETISIFPNPTVAGFLTLRIASGKSTNFSFELFDMQGKYLVSKKVENQETIIQMADFATGVYIIKVLHNEQARKSFKIVKNQ